MHIIYLNSFISSKCAGLNMWNTDSIAFSLMSLKITYSYTGKEHTSIILCQGTRNRQEWGEKRCTHIVKNINYGVGNAARSMWSILIRRRGASNSKDNDMYGSTDWTGVEFRKDVSSRVNRSERSRLVANTNSREKFVGSVRGWCEHKHSHTQMLAVVLFGSR